MLNNPKPTVNSIFREYSNEYIKKYHTTNYEKKNIRAIISCRTEKLGGRIERCDHCGHTITLYNSCRNRHCPLCQFMKKEKWIQDKKNEVLPYQYFHVVFTIPDELNPIVYRNKEKIYKYLFLKVKETLLEVTENEKYFGAKIGFFSILHTWGQKLNLHPHIHCVIPGGGYRNKKNKWVNASKNYLVPIDVLRAKFKYLFLTGLRDLYKNNELYLKKSGYESPQKFQRLMDKLFKKKWIIYIKESFKNSDSVIKYLGRYTHRIAISNYRIKRVEKGRVYFEYRDYKDNNKKKIHDLTILSFIRHFLLHILPYRFVRIRYYGLLSHGNKKKSIEECYEYYNKKKQKIILLKSWQDIYLSITGIDVTKCVKCGIGRMIIKEVIKGYSYRSPPIKMG